MLKLRNNCIFISVTILILAIGLLNSPTMANAATNYIDITSPPNGTRVDQGESITFSWTSYVSSSVYKAYYRINSESWMRTSLSGSKNINTASYAASSNTFSVKITKTIYYGFWPVTTTLETETINWYIDAPPVPNKVSVWYSGSDLKDFSSGSRTDFYIKVGNEGETLYSDYVKLYFMNEQGAYSRTQYVYLPSDYDAGDTYGVRIYEYKLYQPDGDSPEYEHKIRARNYYDGTYTYDYTSTFHVKWIKATVQFKLVSFKLAGTEPGKEQYRFKFSNDGTDIWKNKNGGSSYSNGDENTVNWYFTFSSFKRSDLLVIIIDEKDDSFFDDDNDDIFEGTINLNYRLNGKTGTSAKEKCSDGSTEFEYAGITIAEWDEGYIRGTDTSYYLKIIITISDLQAR